MFFFFFLFVAFSAAERTKHNPCCWANQNEVTASLLGKGPNPRTGVVGDLDVNYKIVSDFLGKKMSVLYYVSLGDGSTVEGRTVIDFNRRIAYEMLKDAGNCSIWQVPFEMSEPCVPDNATYMHTQYAGYGNAKIAFDTWYYSVDGADREIHMDIAPNGCVPIMRVEDGSIAGERTEVVWQFRNYVPGHSNRFNFAVPLECKAAEATETSPIGRRAVEMAHGIYTK